MIPQVSSLRAVLVKDRLQLTSAAALLGVAVVLPLVVHQIPAFASVSWGARFLAMFVAPFIGVMLFRFHVGLIPALVAPAVNHFLFGSPAAPLVGLITIELAVFTAAAFLLLKINRRFWLAGPTAYLVAKGVSAILIAWTVLFPAFAPAGAFVLRSVTFAVPGLVVLVCLHVLLIRVRADEQS